MVNRLKHISSMQRINSERSNNKKIYRWMKNIIGIVVNIVMLSVESIGSVKQINSIGVGVKYAECWCEAEVSSAAMHSILPVGTLVRVKNIETGVKVEVEVIKRPETSQKIRIDPGTSFSHAELRNDSNTIWLTTDVFSKLSKDIKVIDVETTVLEGSLD
jgi:hypothetical protein